MGIADRKTLFKVYLFVFIEQNAMPFAIQIHIYIRWGKDFHANRHDAHKHCCLCKVINQSSFPLRATCCISCNTAIFILRDQFVLAVQSHCVTSNVLSAGTAQPRNVFLRTMFAACGSGEHCQ
ncbi:unnamed protein product [Ixodes persulcatus]